MQTLTKAAIEMWWNELKVWREDYASALKMFFSAVISQIILKGLIQLMSKIAFFALFGFLYNSKMYVRLLKVDFFFLKGDVRF